MAGMPTGAVQLPAPAYIVFNPWELQREAGPLPQKRGEIGYIDSIHGQSEPQPPPIAVTLPPRHPADRDVDLEAQIPSPNSIVPITPATDGHNRRNSTASAASLPNATAKPDRPVYKIAGLPLSTLSLCILQLCIIGGTVAVWAVSIRALNPGTTSSAPAFGGFTLVISLHILFSILLLVQAVFLERTVFRLRAQRYSHLHPGESLPSRIRAAVPTPNIPFAPWNRPPLPTYAAALAQSGAGTGDVEDHLIAAPPPPAYGNTRGSRLILAGYMRESLLAQRPVSALSYANNVPDGEPGPENFETFVNGLRTGLTQTEEEVERDDAERERQRRRTLAALERTTILVSEPYHIHEP